jgi:hypothetical protein
VTAKNLKNLLDALPMRILRKLERLSKETGENVAAIVEYGVAEYERKVTDVSVDALAELRKNPAKRDIVEEVFAALRARAHKAKPEKKSEGGKKGAAGRTKALSAVRRKQIASDAAKARWGTKATVSESGAFNAPRRLK